MGFSFLGFVGGFIAGFAALDILDTLFIRSNRSFPLPLSIVMLLIGVSLIAVVFIKKEKLN